MDDKPGIERLFKAQGTAWKGNQKEVCDDPAKEGNLKYTEIGQNPGGSEGVKCFRAF